jgi:tetratricopeptide (TPR) repeat protein
MGVNAFIHGNLVQAEKAFSQSRVIFLRRGDKGGLGQSAGGVGLVYEKRGDWREAVESYQEAVTRWREMQPETLDEAGHLTSLARVQGKLGDQLTSEQNYLRALSIQDKRAEKFDIVESLIALARISTTKKDWKTAEERYQRAINVLQESAP